MRLMSCGPLVGFLAVAVAVGASPALAGPTIVNGAAPPMVARFGEVSGTLPPPLAGALDAAIAGDHQKAIAIAKQFISDHPRREQAPAYEVLGAAQFLAGDTDAAITALKHAIDLDGTRGSAFTKLGSIELDAGAVAEARKHLEAAIALDGADKLAHERLAAILARQGEREAAIREYRRALDGTGADYSAAKVDLAALLNQERRFGDAVSLLAPAMTPDMPDNRARLVLGTAYLGIGDPTRALAVLRAASERDPKDPNVALAFGIAARAAGQLDVSAASLETASQLKQDWAPAYYQLGLTYLGQQKYADAQRMMEKAQSISPDAAIRQGLAETLLIGGKPDAAIAAFQALAGREDARLSDVVALATAYQATGKLKDAEDTYRDGVRRFPKDATAYLRLGAILALQRNYEAALVVLRQGSALAPDEPRLLRDLAIVLSRLNRREEAVTAAQRLVAAVPQNPSALFLLGSLYQDAGDPQRATATYQELLTLKPDEPFALNNLAALFVAAGNAQAAVPLARRAVELVPGDPNLQDTLGWSLLQAGQAAEAVPVLEKASALVPTDPEGLYRLATAQKATGNVADARRNLEKSLATGIEFKDANAARVLLASLAP
jgi:superkiller protein 3